MQEDEIKSLLQNDVSAPDKNGITPEILKTLDEIILSGVGEISLEAYSVYKKFLPMKSDAPDGMKNELFLAISNYIKEKTENNELYDALFLSRFLIVKSELQILMFYNIAQLLFRLNELSLSMYFLKLYDKKETNKPLKYLTLANFYNLELKDYKTAITYYEKYTKIDATKSVIYTILASLYSKAYGDIGLKDQIYYFEKAYHLKSNDRTVLHGLAFAYERLGNKSMSDKFYRELLNNNPTDTDYYNYGLFLISCGNFIDGHKYFTYRFNIDDSNLKYPLDINTRWDMKSDISDKVLLVNYEQGYGDTFMYCRFVPFLTKFAKKIIFRVQDNLVELIRFSGLISDNIEVVSDIDPLEKIKFDVSMALLDAPYVLGINLYEIPYTKGYLTVPQDLAEEYSNKYIKKSSNLKIGIAYHGDKSANYNGRDIDICRFNNLFSIEGADFYSLQFDSDKEIEGVFNLSSTFKNFTDTACAIKNMDLIISTDNVILNLAGAMGIKTFGLYNFYPNFRWYQLSGENVGWYESVKPFQVEENNRWSIVFSKIHNEINDMLKCSLNKN
ncbi:MAG: hypothetical protein ACI37Q_03260 [Candidatus Gastranaerophilaceae bacterium]